MGTVKKISTLEQCVAQLAEARAKKSELSDQLAAVGITIDRLELEVLNSMSDAGVESVRTGRATVSIKRSTVPTVEDWNALDAFILKHKSLDLLQRRISITAWRERVEAGKAVPGVKPFERVELAWRTAKEG